MTAPPVLDAEQAHAGFAPGAHGHRIRGLETVTEVQAYILRERPGTNKRFAERSAQKLMRHRDDIGSFFECLRILGMTNDPTAQDAEHRATCIRPECDKCGRAKLGS